MDLHNDFPMLAREMWRRMKQGILERAEPFLTRQLIMTVLGILLPALLILCANQNQPHKPTEKLNFLLVGRTGNGKSTSGNTILVKLLVKIREPQITKDVSEKVTDILEHLSSVQLKDLETDQLILQDLQRRTKKILLKVRQEDDGTGVLKKLEKMVEQAKASVDTSLGNLKYALKHAEAVNQMKKELESQTFQNENERNDLERRIKMKEHEWLIQMEKLRSDFEMFRREVGKYQRRGSDNLLDIGIDLANWVWKRLF